MAVNTTYYLGIDIGTTSTKAIAFSPAGEVVATVSLPYDMHQPQPGWAEQNPDEIAAAIINGINRIYTTLSPAMPAFVCFSAAMHSLIAVDKMGSLLTQCIIWADNRANEIAEDLKKTVEGKLFYQLTGVPIHSMSPLCKLLWLRQNQPEIFSAASKFIGIKEYVFFKLFNQYWADTSVASATGLLNIKDLRWEGIILKYIGITAGQLSEIVPVKHVVYGKHAALTIPSDTPFVIGASDGALSNLGTGTGANEMTVTIGTSSAVRKTIQQVATDKEMRTFCYHLKDNLYIAGGASNNGAVVFQWLKDSLLQTSQTYDELFGLIQSIPAGSDGLLFLPYLLGERAPSWNAAAKGVYFGLTLTHTQAHLVRASVEGVMYSLCSIASILADMEQVTAVYAAGGFAKNQPGLQTMADVFNTKVVTIDTVESSALGAVILGAEALNMPLKHAGKIISVHDPRPAQHEVYKKGLEKFERLYRLLQSEM